MPESTQWPRRASAARIALALAGAALLVAGCGAWRPVVVPMPTIEQPAPCAQRPDTVLVLLPGAYSRPEEFVEEGFVAALRDRGIAADVVIADAHLGYYRDRSIFERLQESDVFAPVRARGYATPGWSASRSARTARCLREAASRGVGRRDRRDRALPRQRRTGRADRARRRSGALARDAAPTAAGEADDEARADLALWRWLQGYAEVEPGATPPQRPPLRRLRAGRPVPRQR